MVKPGICLWDCPPWLLRDNAYWMPPLGGNAASVRPSAVAGPPLAWALQSCSFARGFSAGTTLAGGLEILHAGYWHTQRFWASRFWVSSPAQEMGKHQIKSIKHIVATLHYQVQASPIMISSGVVLPIHPLLLLLKWSLTPARPKQSEIWGRWPWLLVSFHVSCMEFRKDGPTILPETTGPLVAVDLRLERNAARCELLQSYKRSAPEDVTEHFTAFYSSHQHWKIIKHLAPKSASPHDALPQFDSLLPASLLLFLPWNLRIEFDHIKIIFCSMSSLFFY